MRNCVFIIYALIPFFILACGNSKSKSGAEGEIDHIDLTIKCTDSELLLSSVFDSIYFIPLETKEECLINRVKSVHFYDSLIIVTDVKRGIMVFSGNGKFLYNIGKIGRGPEEYTSINQSYVNDQLGSVFVIDGANRKLLRYNIDGKYLSKISIPDHYGVFYVDSLGEITLVSSFAQVFIDSYFDFLRLDSNADTIIIQSNSKLQTPGDVLFETLYTPNFSFEHKDYLYIKKVFQDTLAYLDNGKLKPYLILDSKGSSPGFEDIYMQSTKVDYNKYIIINEIVMLNDWLVINLNHKGSQYVFSYNTVDGKITKSYMCKEVFDKIPFPISIQGLRNDLLKGLGSPWIYSSNDVYYSVLYPGKDSIPESYQRKEHDITLSNPIIVSYK